MSGIPFLSLADIVIDEQVARKLPRHLAYYHRALPIAEDDDAITVVMAHPGSHAVVDVLAAALSAHVVPVRGDEKEIQAALDRLFPNEHAGDPLHLQVSSTVTSTAATHIALRLSAVFTIFDHSLTHQWDDFIQAANTAHHDLTVLYTPEIITAADILRRLSTSLLLLSNSTSALEVHSLLCILRGHTPDEIMLEWAARFAEISSTMITLLAVAGSDGFRTRSISPLLNTTHDAGEHVERCVQTLVERGYKGALKLRQGDPLAQIAQEVVEGEYDLVAIAAEAFGDFVQNMLIAIDTNRTPVTPPLPTILIVRPA